MKNKRKYTNPAIYCLVIGDYEGAKNCCMANRIILNLKEMIDIKEVQNGKTNN